MSPRENVSLRVRQKCVSQGMSNVYCLYDVLRLMQGYLVQCVNFNRVKTLSRHLRLNQFLLLIHIWIIFWASCFIRRFINWFNRAIQIIGGVTSWLVSVKWLVRIVFRMAMKNKYESVRILVEDKFWSNRSLNYSSSSFFCSRLAICCFGSTGYGVNLVTSMPLSQVPSSACLTPVNLCQQVRKKNELLLSENRIRKNH